jgi:hypothetical protein
MLVFPHCGDGLSPVAGRIDETAAGDEGGGVVAADGSEME